MEETEELILNCLAELSKMFPEQRMGQLIFNFICRYCPNEDCFYIEDKKVLEHLEQCIKYFKENK